jgi:hypothetical protein
MLSDRVKRLLTTAVDGELDEVERRALQKVLQQSEDARTLYDQMKRDAKVLRNLPQQGLPPHFSCQVLQAIGAVTPAPSIISPSPKRFSMPLWANFAAAAAVMMAVCAGTYMVIVLSEQEKAAAIANANGDQKKQDPELIGPPAPAVSTPSAVAKNTDPDPVDSDQSLHKSDAVAAAPKPDDPKVVEPGSQDVLFTPFIPKLDMFASVTAADLPPIFTVRELDDAKAKAFRESLNRNDALHLDLFCRDTTRAFDRLQNVLKAHGQKLIVDAVAQERFNRKLKTHYLFFTESMTVEEVTKLFDALAAEDKKAESRKDGAFDKLVVKPLSTDSQKTLSLLLGVDVSKWLQPKKAAAPIDPGKLSDSTAEKLAEALNRKTGPTGPGGPARTSEHSMLILSINPIRPNPGSSKEVKQFLEQRRDRKSNAVPLLIILRTPEG